MRTLLLVILLLMTGCATSGYDLGDDPADLTAPGASIHSLVKSGWEISQPISLGSTGLPASEDPSSSDGRSWATFISALHTGDELRHVSNNAGIGYAIFRGGKYLDLYLVTIF